jgi:hypothetical protein
MAHLDSVVRTSRHTLRVVAAGAHQSLDDRSDDLLEWDNINSDSPPDGAESAPAC